MAAAAQAVTVEKLARDADAARLAEATEQGVAQAQEAVAAEKAATGGRRRAGRVGPQRAVGHRGGGPHPGSRPVPCWTPRPLTAPPTQVVIDKGRRAALGADDHRWGVDQGGRRGGVGRRRGGAAVLADRGTPARCRVRTTGLGSGTWSTPCPRGRRRPPRGRPWTATTPRWRRSCGPAPTRARCSTTASRWPGSWPPSPARCCMPRRRRRWPAPRGGPRVPAHRAAHRTRSRPAGRDGPDARRRRPGGQGRRAGRPGRSRRPTARTS